MVAHDGTKLPADAAGSANRTAEAIAAEVEATFKEFAETDAVQDSLFREDRRGDELPEDLSNPRPALAGSWRPRSASMTRRRPARPTTRQNVTDGGDREADRPPSEGPTSQAASGPGLPAVPGGERDRPDSRLMKLSQGFIQGYNAQAVVTKEQIVLAADVTQDTNDVGQLEPMLAQTQQNLVDAGVTAKVGMLLANAGYCSEDNLLTEGPELLIA
ncbi:MAG: hypothetical protein QOH66_2720, partial [Actinomycetota bacterium]|nr:hypothetical protein [Actinomycetota bacterium]